MNPVASPSGPATAIWRSKPSTVVGAAKLTSPSAVSPGGIGFSNVTTGRSAFTTSSSCVSSAVRLGSTRRGAGWFVLDAELPALQLDQVAHLDGDALLTLERAVEDLEELVEALPVADEVDARNAPS